MTDGTTLLGADDKAGIAEVLTVVDEILKEGLHMERSASDSHRMKRLQGEQKHFDVEGFGADYGYTLDRSRKVKTSMRTSMHLRLYDPWSSEHAQELQKMYW